MSETFDDFVGQKALKQRLNIHIQAALVDKRSLGHTLLHGPPGFGKTKLARIIANTLKRDLVSAKMPLARPAFERLFRQFEGGVIFLDEIHASPKSQQEDLLTVLADNYFSCRNGREIELPGITTVIAATTEPEKVIAPLYSRFHIVPYFEAYTDADMTQIVLNVAAELDLSISAKNARGMAVAAGGVPRAAVQLVFAARDIFQATGKMPSAAEARSLLRVDVDGLTQSHQDYIRILSTLGGGPVGLTTISTLLRLHPSVVRELERLLLDRGLIELRTTGRELTRSGMDKGR